MKPTPQQTTILEVFLATQDPLFIQARAGTGKTSTMALLVEAMPGHARVASLCCAFNKAIATELEHRFSPLPSPPACATLNAIGHRLLAKYLGKTPKVNTKKLQDIARQFSLEEELFWPTIQLAEWAKHNNVSWKDPWIFLETDNMPEDLYPHEAIPAAQRLLSENHELTLRGEIDFDDQLYGPLCLGLSLPRYNTVFVDEAQDLNMAQLSLLLTAKKSRLIFFGDPAQAIYGFRGALSGACSTIISETRASVLPLTVSFRCPTAIIQEAQAIVPDISARPEAPSGMVHYPTDLPPLRITGQTTFVLCRYNAPLFGLALYLLRQKTPFTMKATKFERSFSSYLRRIRGKNKKMPHTLLLERSAELSSDPKKRLQDYHETLRHLCREAPNADPMDTLKTLLEQSSKDPASPLLSTIHGAKGLEADRVIYYKHDLLYGEPTKEESNLRYVAITRSKNELYYYV